MRNIDSLASSYWVLHQARSPHPKSLYLHPRFITNHFQVGIWSFCVDLHIHSCWRDNKCPMVWTVTRRLWGVYLSRPLLSYFLSFPPSICGPLGGKERASPSQEGGGACTRGRARLGRTRRKENPAVYSPATVFILISWRASQTWKVTHTVYNYRGNQFCSSWFDSAQSV